MIKDLKCNICGKNDWHGLDYLRDQNYWMERDYIFLDESLGFKICKNCGFVTYDYMEDSRIIERYDRDRPVTNFNNIVTCNRKNEYHRKFLDDVGNYMELTDDLNILDVGCSQGAFLHGVCRDLFGSNLFGVEINKGLSAFARNEYGLNVSSEIDRSRKYDFISWYHVLEHLQYPENALKDAVDVLKPRGIIYISVPLWFDILDEFGGSVCIDFENLYHINHINVFTKQSFYNLLNNAGLEVVKIDTNEMYGHSVLCKYSGLQNEIIKEDYKELEQDLIMQKQAIGLVNDKKLDAAIAAYPKYPDAYILKTMHSDNAKDFKKIIHILDEGLKNCPKSSKLLDQIGKTFFQWDENKPGNPGFYSNNIKKAESIFLEMEETKPGNEGIYYFLGIINAKYKKDVPAAMKYFKRCIDINPSKWAEIYNIIGVFWNKYEEMQKVQ